MEEEKAIPTSEPPSYTQIEGGKNDQAPPSYDSLFGRVKKQKESSTGHVDFFRRLCVLLGGTVVCTILIGICMALPVSMIVIGAIYLDDCPCKRYIPIYLIVAGCFGIVKTSISLTRRSFCRDKDSDDDESYEKKKKENPFEMILNCFLFAWFIAGNVWIYSIYTTYCDNGVGCGCECDKTLYLYAFWLTTSMYILIGSVIACSCLVCMCAICVSP
eukprot:m.2883 g.2883  ORF g.2883 m.2883 type:complete len:216 (+) comp8948_c0_seq1:120-767(+)